MAPAGHRTDRAGRRAAAVGAARRRCCGAVLCGAVLLVSGCSTSRTVPAGLLAGSLENAVGTVQEQPDPELVRQGGPALMLFLDGMLACDPDNRKLLRAAALAYATYCQAFLGAREDEDRAAVLYARAREYGLRLLRRQRYFERALDGPIEGFEKALRRFRRRDAPDLYAAGAAWLGWIFTQADSMRALSELPYALAVVRRVLELDEGQAHGAAHVFMGVYYASQPAGAGRDLAGSRTHFERAIALSNGGNLMAWVTYAEFYGKATADGKFFSETLTRVLQSGRQADKPEFALANALARERAEALLAQKDDIF